MYVFILMILMSILERNEQGVPAAVGGSSSDDTVVPPAGGAGA